LFARERLEQRGFLFENFTLPSIESNLRDWCDLRLIVFTSESLPDWHLEFLYSLKEKYPFIEIHLLGTQPDCLSLVAKEIIKKSVKSNEVYGTFRIDDDDAISNQFVDDLKPYLKQSYVGITISFPKGYSGFFDSNKKTLTTYGETYVPMTALGLCYIANTEMKYKHIFDLPTKGGHKTTDRVTPVLLLSNKHSYLRILHDYGSMYFNKNIMQKNKRTQSKMHSDVSKFQIIKDINISEDLIQETSNQLEAKDVSFVIKFKKTLKNLKHIWC